MKNDPRDVVSTPSEYRADVRRMVRDSILAVLVSLPTMLWILWILWEILTTT